MDEDDDDEEEPYPRAYHRLDLDWPAGDDEGDFYAILDEFGEPIPKPPRVYGFYVKEQ